MIRDTVFYIFGFFVVFGGFLCILSRNPVNSALWLVSTMFSLAGIYLLLGAQFIAAIQVLLYAGGVMVLFLFVIMLLNLGHTESDVGRWPGRLVVGVVVTILAAELLALYRYTPVRLAAEYTGSAVPISPREAFPAGQAAVDAAATQGVLGAVAGPLFQQYLVPFEVTSMLLLAAIIGAVVLAKRKI